MRFFGKFGLEVIVWMVWLLVCLNGIILIFGGGGRICFLVLIF